MSPLELIEMYFYPEDLEWARRIMMCESSNRPDAKNPQSSASGLFQHLPKFWEERTAKANEAGYTNGGDIFDPRDNVAVAAWLFYEGGGKRHWECK